MTAREPRTEGRVVRKALLESERWLTLKDNADRLAYVWLLLNVDDFGNYSGERYRLMRAWRDFGITTVELTSKCLAELSDHGMIGLYDHEGRPFIHIFRLFNSRQWWTRIYPKSPFDDDIDIEEKQRHTKKSINHVSDTSNLGVRGKGLGVECIGISNTHQQPTKPKNKAQAPFVLPDEIPKMQWDAWIESRTKQRKSPTEFAKRLAVSKLLELAEQGHHPAAVLAQSAFNGWSGLFPLKETK